MSDDLTGGDISIRIVGHPDDTLTIKPLGMKPYLLVTIDDVGLDDEDDVAFTVEIGGGVPLDRDEISEFFEGIANAIRDGETVTTEHDDTPTQEPLT